MTETAPSSIPHLDQPALTRHQQGWIVAALVAFVGLAILGPAVVAARTEAARVPARLRRRVRRLGGGHVAALRHRARAWSR